MISGGSLRDSIPMNTALAVIDALNEWVGRLFGFLVLFVVGAVVYEIAMRYLFNAPTLWAFETTTYVSAIVYVLGGGYTLLHRRHVVVDVVYGRFPARLRATADVVTFIFFLFYMGTLVWVGWWFAWDSVLLRESAGTPWDPPIYPVKLAIPIAAALILLQGLAHLIRDLRRAFGELAE